MERETSAVMRARERAKELRARAKVHSERAIAVACGGGVGDGNRRDWKFNDNKVRLQAQLQAQLRSGHEIKEDLLRWRRIKGKIGDDFQGDMAQSVRALSPPSHTRRHAELMEAKAREAEAVHEAYVKRKGRGPALALKVDLESKDEIQNLLTRAGRGGIGVRDQCCKSSIDLLKDESEKELGHVLDQETSKDTYAIFKTECCRHGIKLRRLCEECIPRTTTHCRHGFLRKECPQCGELESDPDWLREQVTHTLNLTLTL